MNTVVAKIDSEQMKTDWAEQARRLGKEFSRRAADLDQNNEFVAANYDDLRQLRFFSAGIPAELGGGGASFDELTEVTRELGRHCGSTALAYVMHTHPLAANVFKYIRGDEGAKNILQKLAANELVISTTGANDWLESSGDAEKVEGGYRINARKRFVSGSPGAQVFVTSVGHDGPEGREVLHFSVPMGAQGISIVETWNTLGMRSTGSHDVVFENVFVAEDAIVLRRPSGVWHPVWNVILPIALPLITAAYVGIAEAAVELALHSAKNKHVELASVVGEMMNALTVAQMSLADMVRTNNAYGFTPDMATTNGTLTRKAIAAKAVKDTVELAAEIVGGPGFYKGHPMERIVRDIRAMHFHPLPARRQQVFSGRIALGIDPIAPA